MESPAMVVIGAVVALSRELSWFEARLAPAFAD